MAFSNTEKVAIRNYCGYPVFGDSSQGAWAFGHRYMTHYGTLEYRMNHLVAEEEVVVRKYLDDLNMLDGQIVSASENLDTESAAVWKRNKTEVQDRERLLTARRLRLCQFFGVPAGPQFGGGPNSIPVIV